MVAALPTPQDPGRQQTPCSWSEFPSIISWDNEGDNSSFILQMLYWGGGGRIMQGELSR